MAKRLKEVDRVIADLDGKIEALMSARNLLIASKVATTHAKQKSQKPARTVTAKPDAAA